MENAIKAASEVSQFLEEKSWRYCIIGGLAVARWGGACPVELVEFSVLTRSGAEKEYSNALFAKFPPRIAGARIIADAERLVLLRTANGMAVDVALGGVPFENEVFARASKHAFTEGCELRTCSAEDVVVLKAFTEKPADWQDTVRVIEKQKLTLDKAYIIQKLTELCEIKAAPQILRRVRKQLGI